MLRNEDIELVKSSVTMKDLCGQYGMKINRSGFISCPFHGSDKHPSMKIYPGRRGYHCFTCGEGGDVISFVMGIDGLEFEPAVRSLAASFGIPISDGGPLTREDRERNAKQRAEREKAEREKAENESRLQETADLIKAYEQILGRLPPMSDLWCKLMDRMVALAGEWELRFQRKE
jgi:DNA primase